jgi:hypothetical protein
MAVSVSTQPTTLSEFTATFITGRVGFVWTTMQVMEDRLWEEDMRGRGMVGVRGRQWPKLSGRNLLILQPSTLEWLRSWLSSLDHRALERRLSTLQLASWIERTLHRCSSPLASKGFRTSERCVEISSGISSVVTWQCCCIGVSDIQRG